METHWQLPEPHSVCHVDLLNGVSTPVRQHGNTAGSRLILCHGNGLAIDLYYPFWSLLEQNYELFVYDMRNHGWNEITDEEEHNIFSFVIDLDRILHAIESNYEKKPTVGVFHSLSALVALLYKSSVLTTSFERQSDGLDALFLFDPPMHRPGKSHTEFDSAVEKTANMARKRTNKFESRQQFVELLEFFPIYARLIPGARELMSETILKDSPSGDGFELRCPPSYEARIVDYVRGFADQADLDDLPVPTRVIGSDPLVPFAYLPADDLSDMLSIDYDFIPDTTHYMQIEQPQQCATYVQKFVDSLRFT